MKIKLIAVGTKMPAWVEAGVQDYRKRLPSDFELSIVEVALSQRSKTADLKQAIAKEGKRTVELIPKGDYVVVLDETGKHMTTEEMASKINELRNSAVNLSLLVGGPDGLSEECRCKADESWSLSALTFPHPVVRIVVVEQLYRVWSLLNKHPYHRR